MLFRSGAGIGFTLAICVIALIREVVGTGALSFGVYFPIGRAFFLHIFPEKYALSIFVQSAGGFLSLGLVLAVMACYKNIKDDKKAAAEKARIEELKKKKAEEEAKKASEVVEEKPAAPAEEKPAEAPVLKPEVKEAI